MSCACLCFQVGYDIVILLAEKEAKGSHLPPKLCLASSGNLCFHPATVLLASKTNLKNKQRK